LDKISKNLYAVQENYSVENSRLNLEKRNYYFTILREYIVSFFFYYIFGRANPSLKTEELKNQKQDLDAWLQNESQTLSGHIKSLEDTSRTLEELKNSIELMEKDLSVFQELIQEYNRVMQEKPSPLTQEERAEKTELLSEYIQKRDETTKGIIQLYRRIDTVMADLMKTDDLQPLLPETTSYVDEKIRKEEQIKTWIDICSPIRHPVAEVLLSALTNRTDTSSEILRQSLLSHPDYLANRILADAVWDASHYFPAMTRNVQREEQVTKFVNAKEVELDALQTQIEAVDNASRQEPVQQALVNTLENMLKRKRELSQSIYTVLVANQHINPHSADIDSRLVALHKAQVRLDLAPNLSALCESINHPIAKELRHYLKYQTSVSLNALKQHLKNYKDFETDPVLVNLLWEAGRVFPALQELDPNNPKRMLVAKIADLEERIKTEEQTRDFFKWELNRYKNEVAAGFHSKIDALHIDESDIERDIATIEFELQKTSPQSPEAFELEKFKHELEISLDDARKQVGFKKLELGKMQEITMFLGGYISRENKRFLKTIDPTHAEDLFELNKNLLLCKASIQKLNAEHAACSQSLEKFSVADLPVTKTHQDKISEAYKSIRNRLFGSGGEDDNKQDINNSLQPPRNR
jgi:uncharacterized protein YnzC (UPF0291/DUF896 family)